MTDTTMSEVQTFSNKVFQNFTNKPKPNRNPNEN